MKSTNIFQNRGTFETWVKTEHPALEPYLLAMFNEEDLDRVIYQHAFKERLAQEK